MYVGICINPFHWDRRADADSQVTKSDFAEARLCIFTLDATRSGFRKVRQFRLCNYLLLLVALMSDGPPIKRVPLKDLKERALVTEVWGI